MKSKIALVCCAFLFVGITLLLFAAAVGAADAPKGPVTIKLDGAKMAPVVFSHAIHIEKAKAECVKCHHKDAQGPKACTTCHGKEEKGATPAAKDAFHKLCQTCHKEMVAKGAKAPTKCNECHKK